MSLTTEAEIYVVYANGEGYFTSKKRKPFNKDLSTARFFNRHCDAVNSIARNPLVGDNRSKSVVIPVPVSVDEKVMFKKILKGK